MPGSDQIEYKLWSYTPSTAGGAIACIVFFILTTLHAWRLAKNRTWFCIPFVVGGLVSASFLSHVIEFEANSNEEANLKAETSSLDCDFHAPTWTQG